MPRILFDLNISFSFFCCFTLFLFLLLERKPMCRVGAGIKLPMMYGFFSKRTLQKFFFYEVLRGLRSRLSESNESIMHVSSAKTRQKEILIKKIKQPSKKIIYSTIGQLSSTLSDDSFNSHSKLTTRPVPLGWSSLKATLSECPESRSIVERKKSVLSFFCSRQKPWLSAATCLK